MGTVIVDISTSLDGYVTGPDAGPDNGLGTGGEGIHAWVEAAGSSPVDRQVLDDAFAASGAVVMGRNLYDVVTGPHGWTDEVGYGYDQDQSARPPMFVATHRHTDPPAGPGFTLVGGLAAAIDAAREAADDRDVVIMGGGDVCGQAIAAGLVDEVRLHLSPLLVGSGTPLFRGGPPARLRQTGVLVSPHATHLHYVVER